MNQQRQHGNAHANQRGNQRRKPPQQKRPHAVDIWRDTGPLPDLEPIAVSHDAGALVRSLGDPPVHDGSAAAGYFVAVAERAAKVATALAYSAGVVAAADDEDG
jgi:hypothetical protein